jgi:hypothetical protein
MLISGVSREKKRRLKSEVHQPGSEPLPAFAAIAKVLAYVG